MHEKYTVTAVVTTYKRKWRQIERAITSIIRQSYPVTEILLIDDNVLSNASDSGKIAENEFTADIKKESLRFREVTYISMGGNQGVGAARNRAISLAKGDLIGFLDDDDEWKEDKIEKQVRMFERDPELGLVFGLGKIFYDDTGKTSALWQESIFKEKPLFQDMLWGDYVGSASQPLMKADLLRKLGGFNPDRKAAVEDYELWIRISKESRIWGTPDILYIKHMDQGEHISTSNDRVLRGYLRIYEEFRNEYDKNILAKRHILRNIVRVGVKSRNPEVLPYIFRWVRTYFF